MSGAGFVAFRSRDFRLHCLARLLYGIAQSMQVVAIGWYVYAVTQDPFALGLSGLTSFAPAAFFALFTGHVADTFDRRSVVAVAFAASASAALGLVVIATLGVRDVRLIYACIFVLGASRAFANPAVQALTPNLVPKEHFANAVSWFASALSTSRIVGPAIGGLLFIVGQSVPFIVALVLFCASSVAVALISVRSKPAASRGAITWETLSAGLRFIWSRQVIFGGISLDLVAVLFGGATALLPIVASDILHVGPWGLGLLRAAPAMGAILSGTMLAHFPIRRRAGKKMLLAVVAYGCAIIGFGLSQNLILSMLLLATVGAVDQVSVLVRHTMVQSDTPDEMRGRVSAVSAIFTSGSGDLGEFESGTTAAWWGVVPAIIVGGMATIAFAGIWAVCFPQLRNRDKLTEP